MDAETIPAWTWHRLRQAAEDPTDPCRLSVLATASQQGGAARMLVLRGARPDTRRLLFYTDARSPKCLTLSEHPRSEALFYDGIQAVQLRMKGLLSLHHLPNDPIKTAEWLLVPEGNKNNYRTALAPGSPKTASHGDPAPTMDPFTHFAVLVLTVHGIDWLHIDPLGPRRFSASWDGSTFQTNETYP